MDKWITVAEMQNSIKDTELKLLSNFGEENDFWSDYRNNSEEYDLLFVRFFKNFRYFNQDLYNDETILEITQRFIDDVKRHLMINRKKYEELYRIELLTNENYDFINPLNYSITKDGMTIENENITNGQRTDTTNKNETNTSGSRSDVTTENIGSEVNEVEKEISAFNDSGYSPNEKTTETIGSKINSNTFTKGQEIDNNLSSASFIKGSQLDSRSNSIDEDITTTYKGNKGDIKITELINSHNKLWRNYDFYNYIFKDISRELLLV